MLLFKHKQVQITIRGSIVRGLKVPHPVEYFYILQAIIKLIYKYLIK